MGRQQITDKCRICGQIKLLTEEHIIPRVAGGGAKIKLYNGSELLKTLGGDEKPFGRIKQNGHAEYTLCRDCNSLSGRKYDEDFANFFNIFSIDIPPHITIPKNVDTSDYLENKKIDVEIRDIKPFNVAKRILVSFCSVEHDGLTDRIPEIRQAILDKDYSPKIDDFSLYLSLHTGDSLFFGRQVVLINATPQPIIESYAGIETDILAFYLAPHDEQLKGGHLTKTLDITNWLTQYKYDEVVNIQMELTFNKSLSIRFPIPQSK